MLQLLRATVTSGRPEPMEVRDSAQVYQAALGHGLTAALREAITRHGLRFPARERRLLDEEYLGTLWRNEILMERLVPFYRAMEADGIKAVTVKGPTICSLAYDGDLGSRRFHDIDMVVDQHDIPRLRSLVDRLGGRWLARVFLFGTVVPFDTECLMPGGFLGESHFEWSGMRFDVKEHIVPYTGVTRRRFDHLERNQLVRQGQLTFRTLNIEQQIILLATHTAREAVILRPFYELARICWVHRNTINWEEIIACRDEWFGPLVYIVLDLCAGLFGECAPRPVLERMKTWRVSMYKRMFPINPCNTRNVMHHIGHMRVLYLGLLACPDNLSRARYVGRVLHPPASSLAAGYHGLWGRARYLSYVLAMAYRAGRGLLTGTFRKYSKPGGDA